MTFNKNLTNRQILESPKDYLTAIQRQIRFLMEMGLQQKACPNCGTQHNLPEAAGVDVDAFSFGNHGSDRIGACKGCGRTLIYTLPMMGDWHWRLDPAEAVKK